MHEPYEPPGSLFGGLNGYSVKGEVVKKSERSTIIRGLQVWLAPWGSFCAVDGDVLRRDHGDRTCSFYCAA